MFKRGGSSFFTMLLLLITTCMAMPSFAQIKWNLQLKGTIYDENNLKLGGVTVSLRKNGKEVEKKLTDETAMYELTLEQNEEYELYFSKSSYLTKIIEVNTQNVPPKAVVDGVFNYRANVSMLRDFPGVDHSVMSEPVVRIFYVKSTQEFGFDPGYKLPYVLGCILLYIPLFEFGKILFVELVLNPPIPFGVGFIRNPCKILELLGT